MAPAGLGALIVDVSLFPIVDVSLEYRDGGVASSTLQSQPASSEVPMAGRDALLRGRELHFASTGTPRHPH